MQKLGLRKSDNGNIDLGLAGLGYMFFGGAISEYVVGAASYATGAFFSTVGVACVAIFVVYNATWTRDTTTKEVLDKILRKLKADK